MRPIVKTWTAANTTSIAQAQTLVAAGNLVLNGPLRQPGYITVNFLDFTRSITLTSTANLSGINFTINGMLNNSPLSEVLAGPNNNTVTSVNIYDSIVSITASAGFSPNTVSVGTGLTGRTHWINFDYDILIPNYSTQVVVTNAINYTYNVTLDDPNIVATPTVFAPIVAMTGATTSQFASVNDPLNYINITVNSAGATGSLVATFLFQGLAS